MTEARPRTQVHVHPMTGCHATSDLAGVDPIIVALYHYAPDKTLFPEIQQEDVWRRRRGFGRRVYFRRCGFHGCGRRRGTFLRRVGPVRRRRRFETGLRGSWCI